MMAFFAAKLRFEEAFRTLGMTFAAGQLPVLRTGDTLIAPRTATSGTAQVAFCASASIAVISVDGNK